MVGILSFLQDITLEGSDNAYKGTKYAVSNMGYIYIYIYIYILYWYIVLVSIYSVCCLYAMTELRSMMN